MSKRAAIIGYGRMARGHAKSLAAVGCALVATADISAEARDKFREDYAGSRAYEDYHEMLGVERPDIVAVVTHDADHCAPVVAAARAGARGIVCEKPMAINLAEADAMLAACDEAGAVLVINHQRHYGKQYTVTRELVAAGAVGELRSVEAYLVPQCLHTDGTHTVHMLLDLLGWPKIRHLLAAVDGHSGATYYGHRVEDAGTALIAFESGLHAHLTWGKAKEGFLRPTHPFSYHQFIIHGEQGSIELNGDEWHNERPLVRVLRGPNVDQPALPELEPDMVQSARDLLRSIETGAPHPLGGRTGRDALEGVMACYESARRRAVVTFPLEVRDNPFLALCADGTFPPEPEPTSP